MMDSLVTHRIHVWYILLRDPNPAYLLVEEYAHEDQFQN